MTTVTAKESRENLSDIIDRVEAGEEVVVIRHSKPVMRLIPDSPSRSNVKMVVAGIERYYAYLDAAGINPLSDPDKSTKELYHEAVDDDPKYARYTSSK